MVVFTLESIPYPGSLSAYIIVAYTYRQSQTV
jgi:hypothetical protein